MQSENNQTAETPIYPCPDCQETVQMGSACGACSAEFYSEDLDLAELTSDAEFRRMFPDVTPDQIADMQKVVDEVCPDSQDALDRGWM
jgi:hypothetical protein